MRKSTVVVGPFVAIALGASAVACGSGNPGPTTDQASQAQGPTTTVGAIEAAADKAVSNATASKQSKLLYIVKFKIKDNFTNGLIKAGIATNVFDMLKDISKSAPGGGYTIRFEGTFPMQDKYGKAITPDPVVFRATFMRSTAGRIQYDNIDTTSLDTLGDLADGAFYLHPAFD